MPDEVPLEITPPPCFAEHDREELVRELEQKVAEREAECRAEIEKEGPGFLGEKRARSESPTDCPQSYEKKWKLSPTIQARRPGPRIEELKELVTFRDCYRAALELYRAGVENVVFPAGTYWMRAFHRQKCEPMLSGAVPAAP